jgi:hypothetical protein
MRSGPSEPGVINLAGICFARDRRGKAELLYRAALTASRVEPHLPSLASARWGLADLADRAGSKMEAVSGYRDAMKIHKSLGNMAWVALLKRNIAETLIDEGCLDDATPLLSEAEAAFQGLSSAAGLFWVLYSRVKLELLRPAGVPSKDLVERLVAALSSNHGILAETTALIALAANANGCPRLSAYTIALPDLPGEMSSSDEPKWRLASRLRYDAFDEQLMAAAWRLVFQGAF